jgi:hypothetical protein
MTEWLDEKWIQCIVKAYRENRDPVEIAIESQ